MIINMIVTLLYDMYLVLHCYVNKIVNTLDMCSYNIVLLY